MNVFPGGYEKAGYCSLVATQQSSNPFSQSLVQKVATVFIH